MNVVENLIRIVLIVGSFLSAAIAVYPQEVKLADIDPKSQDFRCVEKNYRHKSALRLERMSVEQLIDEDSRHWNYHVGLMDKYGMFTLAHYTDAKRLGFAVVPVLTKIALEFTSHPNSKCQENRFFTAFAWASDYDEQIARLRSARAGRAAISAALDSVKAMVDAGLADDTTHPYNESHFGLLLLENVRGINEFDGLMREMFGSEYHVQFSDEDFRDFVDFLTEYYPTYPGWTPRIKMSQNLKLHKKRYYQAYLSYRKHRQISPTKH